MPGPYKFGKSSLEKLATAHEDLQKVFHEVIKQYNCSILCGHRGEAEQNEAFARGASKVKFPKSRHNSTPSEAVDAAPWPLNWQNVAEFKRMAEVVKDVADQLGVEIEYGGDWVTFKDYPHFQLAKKR